MSDLQPERSNLNTVLDAIDKFEETVAAHTVEVIMLRHEVAEHDEVRKQDRRQFRLTIAAISTVLAFLVFYGWYDDHQAQRDRRDIKNTLQLLENAIDPNSVIGQRNQASQAEAVGTIVLENDCRVRRALAELPQPEPGQPCKLP